MKKLWLMVALVVLGGLISETFADVQNIRLSGDIRVRGYYLKDAGGDGVDQVKGDATFISERTRVSVEADLEDHVLVVVTLQAEGLWGSDNATSLSSGAGSAGANGPVNRRFDLGVSEAYVQLNEVFYTPATLKVGRQYLHYGHGLILSSAEQEYNYDAGRLVLDYYPLVIDLVGAQLVNHQSFGATGINKGFTGATSGASDLLFLNARYEMTDSIIKNAELYFGWMSQAASGLQASSRVPPSIGGASPMIIGARTDLQPVENMQVWAEGVYEFGTDGTTDFVGGGTENISAFLFNAGARYTMKSATWTPALNANYIYASGGGKGQDVGSGIPGRGQFRPWFDYAEGYNGYVFGPALSNIHIFNVGASVKPYENTTLALQAYYYLRADKDSFSGSNPNVDFGGLNYTPNSESRDLGWEIDAILGYDYSKDVRAQLVYGAFIPNNAFENAGSNVTAQEVRAELNVKF